MAKTFKEISFSKKFRYREEKSEYTFQLKKRHGWWWLLLLLLLLLFIKCERDITVSCIDATEQIPVEAVGVSLSYTSHILFDDGKILNNKSLTYKGETDSVGNALFKDLPCSVFSYIFYCFSNAEILVDGEICYGTTSEIKRLFHYTNIVEVELDRNLVDIPVKVVDLETDDIIVDALVKFKFYNGTETVDSARTNPAGEIIVKDVWKCGMLDSLSASAYGYSDTLKTQVEVLKMFGDEDSCILKLRPLKDRFNFFVKNLYTKEPIPGAHAEVTLTDAHSTRTRGMSQTDVDGKGRGFYENAFVLAKVEIKATKEHYKPGELVGDYTVEEFNALPDSLRVVYLEPEPYVSQFQNLDSITHKPISGVSNEITINGIDNSTRKVLEISNSNGYFDVYAMAGDEIFINSEKRRDYKPKYTHIEKFEKEEKIYMEPILANIQFRTIESLSEKLLPDCGLAVFVDGQLFASPRNSGNGEFVVEGLRMTSKISITANKSGYKQNDWSVRSENVSDLINAPQEDRDIPLEIDLPPCNGMESAGGYSPTPQVKTFNMGKMNSSFVLEYWGGNSIPDVFEVYDDDGTLLFSSGPTAGGRLRKSISFKGPKITIKVISNSDSGTAWEYIPHCP